MYKEFNLYLKKIFKDMELERSKLSHPFVGSEHLLLSLLKNDKDIIICFSRHGVTYDSFLNKLLSVVGSPSKNVDFNLYTPLLKRVIDFASEEAKNANKELDTKFIIMSLLEENEGVAVRILISMGVDLDIVYDEICEDEEDTIKLEHGKNLNETVNNNEVVIGRDKEITYIIETLLRKKKSNPLLIGDAGVGKSAIVEELARKINRGCVPKKLKNNIIYNIDMSNIVAGTKYRGEFEEKLNSIINKAISSKNIILFIDEIHTVLHAGGAEGAIGAGDILKPFLARGDLKIIGATTTEEFLNTIKKDKALTRRFEIINILEPTKEETINILNKVKIEYEKFHNVKISKQNIIDIIEYGEKFIFNKKNPDKSLDFLDSVSSFVELKNENYEISDSYLEKLQNIKSKKILKLKEKDYDKAAELFKTELSIKEKINELETNKQYTIHKKDILSVLEKKTTVPMLLNKKTLLKNIEKKLVNYMDKDNLYIILNIFKEKLNNLNTIKSIYLYGDADNIIKCIKEEFIGSNFIILKGEDFSKEESITKLVGVDPGYQGHNTNHLLSSFKSNPYGIIYIKNYDKLSSATASFFEDILKTGKYIDTKGDEINLSNTIIIASSKEQKLYSVGFMSKEKDNSNIKVFDARITCKTNQVHN